MTNFEKLYHRLWYRSVLGLCAAIIKIWLPVKVTGRHHLRELKNLQNRNGFVVVSNHDSHFDVVLLAFACREELPPLRFFASHDLIDYEIQRKRYTELLPYRSALKKNLASRFLASFTMWFVKSARSILVNRDSNQNKFETTRAVNLASKKVLRDKGALGVFPDAGINRNEARSGALTLAKNTDSVIIPVHIKSKPKPWSRKNPWHVSIGEALDPCTIATKAKPGQTPTEALMLHIQYL